MNLFDKRNNLVWRDYLKILYKRIWWAAVPFVVAFSVGLFMALNKKPVYQCSALIKISENADFSQALRKLLPGVGGARSSIDVKQLAKEMTSTKYIDALIDRLKLKPDDKLLKQAKEIHAEFPDKKLDEITRGLHIDKLKNKIQARGIGRDMIEVKVSGPEPEGCYLATKTLIDLFVEESTQYQLRALENATKFSDQQIRDYKAKLDEAEKRLEEFNQSLSVQKVENEELENTDVKRFEETLASIDLHLDELEKRLRAVDSELSRKFPLKTAPETPTMATLQAKIDERIDKIAALMYQFAWKDPQLVKLNAEIDQLREQWKAEVNKSYRVILTRSELKALDLFVERSLIIFDIDNWTRRKQGVKQVIDKYKRYISEDPTNQQTLTKLQEEVEQTKSIYNTLVEQARGTKLKEAMERADLLNRIHVLEPARRPIVPLSSGRRMTLILTLFVAFGLGFGSVYAVEYLDKSVRTVEEAESEFNIPVIGVICDLKRELNENGEIKVLTREGS